MKLPVFFVLWGWEEGLGWRGDSGRSDCAVYAETTLPHPHKRAGNPLGHRPSIREWQQIS